MLVTTSTRGQEKLEDQARKIAEELQFPYIKRKRYSVQQMLKQCQAEYLILVETEGIKCIFKEDIKNPFFFHPSSAMFRIKRLGKGEHDPLVQAAELQEGMSFLDCTLGLASDSIVASFATGPTGFVVGIESVSVFAYLVQQGLQEWDAGIADMNAAMKRIQVKNAEHLEYLKQSPTDGFDIVYFDPMFENQQVESTGISPLKKMANYSPLSVEVIEEAKRVARQKVILKDSSYSSRFHALGFKAIERKYASHWFGVIELG
ncbi:class I SAM-dependent methyltransferase [Caldalkalibacillus mannanilyticus]|uniref:class I SAM-dependent methyltransferase n=1 Tax=Caldalkalibacillus mannanilyticus TaxID=1418 RepID=UPI000467EF28|nr:class I SAM-dependent methyltransferase [Caldalkalibacillus mannanilyticus]